jgi:hypothetical protein
LSKIHYLSSIGRLRENTNDTTIKTENGNDEGKVMVDNTLPVYLSYDKIKKIKLVNPHLARIVKVNLIFFPFYILIFY